MVHNCDSSAFDWEEVNYDILFLRHIVSISHARKFEKCKEKNGGQKKIKMLPITFTTSSQHFFSKVSKTIMADTRQSYSFDL